MTFSKKSKFLNQLNKNRLRKSKLRIKIKNWHIRNPKGKIIRQPFILNPNYQEITTVKSQIKWCKETALYYLKEDFNYFLFKEYIEKHELLKKGLKKLAR